MSGMPPADALYVCRWRTRGMSHHVGMRVHETLNQTVEPDWTDSRRTDASGTSLWNLRMSTSAGR